MASKRDLKKLQDRQHLSRQQDHLNREQEENDHHHKTREQRERWEQLEGLVEKLQKDLAERDKVIERLESQKNPSTPPHHSSPTPYGKAFDGQSCTPRATE